MESIEAPSSNDGDDENSAAIDSKNNKQKFAKL
jgi:hypothetical protein